MKKTIIALMALAGVAAAKSVDCSSYEGLGLSSDIFVAYDFSTNTANMGGGLTGNVIVDNGVATFSQSANGYANASSPYASSTTIGSANGDFSITMDLVDLGACDAWDCLLSVYSSTSKGEGYNNSLVLHVNSNNELVWSSSNGGEASFANNAAYNLGTGIYASSTEGETHASGQTLTLVQDSTAHTLTLYVDSEQVAQATNWEAAQIKMINFGCIPGGTKAVNDAKIDNMAIWNTALTADQVKALVVPEPTTATLSLLALCGLAARRRRK